MSRNQDRLGLGEDNTPPQDESPPAPAMAGPSSPSPSGGSFNWSVPTEFVTLPSEGLFYPEGSTLHNRKHLEIRFMTAKEEDILTSRPLLKAGLAIDRMLENVLEDKSIDVGELLIGDKNALLVAARCTGYGGDYEAKIACPACDTMAETLFDVSEPPIVNFRKAMEESGIELTDTGTFLILLPMSNTSVECRFLTGADELKMFKESERKAKRKIEGGTMTDALRTYIVSVNGDSSGATIAAFVQGVPARDARALRRIYSEVVPNIDLKQYFDCTTCGYQADLEVPLGVDFLWSQ